MKNTMQMYAFYSEMLYLIKIKAPYLRYFNLNMVLGM